MTELACPGVTADWLNGWLAAIGATVLVDGLHLTWTEGASPTAVFSTDADCDIAAVIADALPTTEWVESLPTARVVDGIEEFPLNPNWAAFSQRARIARAHAAGWVLSSFYTDALLDRGQAVVEKGPFLPGMPGKANSLHDRLRKLTEALDQVSVEETLAGNGVRVQQFGLGFDVTRLGSLGDRTDHWVDPAIELLALAGLRLFPTRSNGATQARQRGWTGPRTRTGSFRWPAWRPVLDAMAIDAFLDIYWSTTRPTSSLGVIAEWEMVPYNSLGSQDSNRGFGSRQMRSPSLWP